MRRENAKLHRNLDGIKDMEKYPAAIVIVDVPREAIAVAEARRLNIPIVAITDTNANPDLVNYPIAGNDDAIRSISIILEALNDAVIEGSDEGRHARQGLGQAGRGRIAHRRLGLIPSVVAAVHDRRHFSIRYVNRYSHDHSRTRRPKSPPNSSNSSAKKPARA